jgi:hypothetical protein
LPNKVAVELFDIPPAKPRRILVAIPTKYFADSDLGWEGYDILVCHNLKTPLAEEWRKFKFWN